KFKLITIDAFIPRPDFSLLFFFIGGTPLLLIHTVIPPNPDANTMHSLFCTTEFPSLFLPPGLCDAKFPAYRAFQKSLYSVYRCLSKGLSNILLPFPF